MASPSWPGISETFNVILRTLGPCLALVSVLGGSGAFPVTSLNANTFNTKEEVVQPLAPHQALKPLQDLIARGEGHYNSVNRGYAGDTPGGIQSLTGLTFENYTVGQVMQLQRRWLHAVGRYQFIPVTLRFAVNNSDVSIHDMFTPYARRSTPPPQQAATR